MWIPFARLPPQLDWIIQERDLQRELADALLNHHDEKIMPLINAILKSRSAYQSKWKREKTEKMPSRWITVFIPSTRVAGEVVYPSMVRNVNVSCQMGEREFRHYMSLQTEF